MRDLIAGSKFRPRLEVKKTMPWKYSRWRRNTGTEVSRYSWHIRSCDVPATRLFCSRRLETSVIRASKNTSASSIRIIAFHMEAYCKNLERFWSISDTVVPSSPLDMITSARSVYSATVSAVRVFPSCVSVTVQLRNIQRKYLSRVYHATRQLTPSL